MNSDTTLIVLDRDGVLNRIVIDADHGTIDSPLNPSQIELLPGVAGALARLTEAGFSLALATNQPSAAKGKTTKENLVAAHERLLELAQAEGGRIGSSHICFHRSEDGCSCRKPATGLLEEAFRQHPGCRVSESWMVGDGITDVLAGARMGMKTAFLGPRKCDACKIYHNAGVTPDLWADDLVQFVEIILEMNEEEAK